VSAPNGYRARRAGVLRVLKEVVGTLTGWSLECEGTAQQLLDAGVVSAEMLDLPGCSQKSGRDE
jgi:hypothetical protein